MSVVTKAVCLSLVAEYCSIVRIYVCVCVLTFSHFGGCLSVWMTGRLTVQELFSVDSDLLILAFVACAFGVISPKIVAKISVK